MKSCPNCKNSIENKKNLYTCSKCGKEYCERCSNKSISISSCPHCTIAPYRSNIPLAWSETPLSSFHTVRPVAKPETSSAMKDINPRKDGGKQRKEFITERENTNNTIWVILLLLIAIILLSIGVSRFIKSKAHKNWPATGGEVISTEIQEEEHRGDLNYTSYYVKINYEYIINYKKYISNSIGLNTDSYFASTWSNAYEICNDFPQGKKIRVYYDPNNPHTSILTKGVNNRYYIFYLGFGLIFLGFGVWRLYSLKKYSKIEAKPLIVVNYLIIGLLFCAIGIVLSPLISTSFNDSIQYEIWITGFWGELSVLLAYIIGFVPAISVLQHIIKSIDKKTALVEQTKFGKGFTAFMETPLYRILVIVFGISLLLSYL